MPTNLSYAVWLRNQKWKRGKFPNWQKDWLEHPYHFETKEQAVHWGQYMMRAMSEIDEYEVRPSPQRANPPRKLLWGYYNWEETSA